MLFAHLSAVHRFIYVIPMREPSSSEAGWEVMMSPISVILSALKSFIDSYISFFSFTVCDFTVWVHSHCSVVFNSSMQCFSASTALINPPNSKQTKPATSL